MKTSILLLLCCSTLLCSGCFELGLIEDASIASVAEDAAWTSVAERSLLSPADEAVLSEIEMETWNSTLSPNELLYKLEDNVRAVFRNGENPKLYLTENNREFAEVVNRQQLRFTNGKEITLRENISTIKGSNINVRQLPTTNAGIIERIQNQQGRIFLVLDEQIAADGKWFRVYVTGIKESGWIKGTLLFPLLGDSSKNNTGYSGPHSVARPKAEDPWAALKKENSQSSYPGSNTPPVKVIRPHENVWEDNSSPITPGNWPSIQSPVPAPATASTYNDNGWTGNTKTNINEQGWTTNGQSTNNNNGWTQNGQSSIQASGSTRVTVNGVTIVSESNAGQGGTITINTPSGASASAAGNSPHVFSVNTTITNVVAGNIVIEENVYITLTGIISGNVVLKRNATIAVTGVLSGNVTNYGGTIINRGGVISGNVYNVP